MGNIYTSSTETERKPSSCDVTEGWTHCLAATRIFKVTYRTTGATGKPDLPKARPDRCSSACVRQLTIFRGLVASVIPVSPFVCSVTNNVPLFAPILIAQKSAVISSEVGSGMLVSQTGRAPRLQMVSFNKLDKGTLVLGVIFKVMLSKMLQNSFACGVAV